MLDTAQQELELIIRSCSRHVEPGCGWYALYVLRAKAVFPGFQTAGNAEQEDPE
jgi:hypothetical protein